MTESEWLQTYDIFKLIPYVSSARLFACGCIRMVRSQLRQGLSWSKVLNTAEMLACGKVKSEELETLRATVAANLRDDEEEARRAQANFYAVFDGAPELPEPHMTEPQVQLLLTDELFTRGGARRISQWCRNTFKLEDHEQAWIIRELTENPFRLSSGSRATVFNLLASMREWVSYDESTGSGLKPPGNPDVCPRCRWRHECTRRLGPVSEGDRLTHWTDLAAAPVRPEVHPPTDEPEPEPQFAAVLPASGLWLGSTDDGTQVTVPLPALPTHVAVVGAAGSGKTWLAKAVVEEAVLAGVAVLAIDPQGDLVQFLRPADPAKLSDVEVDQGERFRQTAAVRVFTPGTDHGIRVSLNPLKLSAGSGEDADDLFATTAGHLVTLAKATGEVESQKTFVFQLLRTLTRGPARDLTLGEVASALRDPAAAGLDDPDRFVKKAERERLARQLNNLEHGPMARLFTGGRPLDLGWLVAPPAEGRVPLNVVYLNALTDDTEKQSFVAALAVEVYRWMIAAGGSAGRPRLLFYLDEARDYLPAGTAQPPAKKPLLRLFAQGRKYGVACLVCTQSPRSVDYNVFSNCSTKLIGRLESAQDVERVRDWFAPQGSPPSWLSGRVGAVAGSFVGRWPGQSRGPDMSFRSRNLLTAHEGAWSPERVATEVAAARSSCANAIVS